MQHEIYAELNASTPMITNKTSLRFYVVFCTFLGLHVN